MKEVFGPVIGFKILVGPGGASKRLDTKIDEHGIEVATLNGIRWSKKTYPFDQISAEATDDELILTLAEQRYVLQAKKPEKWLKKIDEFKNKPAPMKKGTGMACVVCGKDQANATCKQCGGKVCPSHSNYINIDNATYCHRCLVLCPRCKSAQLSAHRGGFQAGSAVLGWALGGVVLGALLGTMGMSKVELVCHACGNKWKPKI